MSLSLTLTLAIALALNIRQDNLETHIYGTDYGTEARQARKMSFRLQVHALFNPALPG